MSPPAQPSLDLDQAVGLFSERQIARPLIVALLITLALYPTLMHFLEPDALPDWIGRYLGNGYCRFMLALFVASALYAVLQYLGLQSERRALIGRDTPDQDGRQSVRPRLQDWIDFLSGREQADAERVPTALRHWHGRTHAREDSVHLSDYVLLVRGQQHQHNFAPIGFAIWVLPMLGFIGTVLGITQAIGGLADSVAVTAVDGGGLGGVLGGLQFAFDTTFVGLVLVIPLMLALLVLRARAQTLDMLYYRRLLDRLFPDVPERDAVVPKAAD
ncbi:MotA/TolQ/ExbB proton channel family protein [Allochromatium humboldtianum]|uniref:MotA/TolQ/ExbB proton channel family protein n=1 Tax=Allochromatium humboldtianum TaxID=504901 RepID=A0A850R8W5_9GAMM|nr:MotA/TolQ/ExbB proton channel family protein [Allochromatium humboldtianum]NVZ08806.1 MotA/TolQ/ExbB proton channel family protein [Allochromatium humboldtianum]